MRAEALLLTWARAVRACLCARVGPCDWMTSALRGPLGRSCCWALAAVARTAMPSTAARELIVNLPVVTHCMVSSPRSLQTSGPWFLPAPTDYPPECGHRPVLAQRSPLPLDHAEHTVARPHRSTLPTEPLQVGADAITRSCGNLQAA